MIAKKTSVTKTQEEVFISKFKKVINKSNSAPFLFVGSGFSIRYYNIPTWINLLSLFVKSNRDCFNFEFGYYSSKCNQDPLLIAEMLASEFHEKWWSLDRFNDSRKEYVNISGNSQEIAFKIELCKSINEIQKPNEDFVEELELLSKSVLSGILTTNWDDFLSTLFPDFNPKIGQGEVLFSEPHSFGDILKIHGCSTRPSSLVVTRNDYDNFMQNNHYLNSKILTLFVDFPIIFMGYSISDPNIELILKNLIDCLNNDFLSVDKLNDRLFFVEWQSNPCVPSIETSSHMLKSISIPITKIKAHSYVEIFQVLSEIPRKLSVDVLRKLQSMVYDFVLTTEPSKKILVNGMDDLKNLENLEVVVGFGNISKLHDKGVVGLKDLDLLEDIIFDNLPNESYPEIVEKLLPAMVKKNIYIPFFKYQRLTNNLNEDNSLKDFKGTFETLSNSQNITEMDYRLAKQQVSIQKQLIGINSLEELIENCNFTHTIQRIPYLDRSKINPIELREFLKSHWKSIDKKTAYFSNFRKCICLLDYLENTYHK